MLLPGNHLPLAGQRGDVATAPPMVTQGMLAGQPQNAQVSGDVRANENSELTCIHLLFAREHNRIAAQLPRSLTPEQRFQITR